ncbi:MAG: di-heme oxidoredictase family protein [Bacteroidota bacterium]
MRIAYVIFLIGLATLLWKCQKRLLHRAKIGEELSGGTGSVKDATHKAFDFLDRNLHKDNSFRRFFESGESFFNTNWTIEGASSTARDGLGPLFNSNTCASCHFKDGRGRPPIDTTSERGLGLLLRLSIGNDPHSGPIPDPNYGLQLQDSSIPGIRPEADFKITYENISGRYADGDLYMLRKPQYKIVNLKEGPLTATEYSPRIANQIIGMGLLEAIDEATLRSFADEMDEDGDGISGRPNIVPNIETKSEAIGRFGWKANQPTVKQQVAAAFAGDIGITSSLFPNENCPPSINCDELPDRGTLDISDKNLDRVALYTSSLAVPWRRDWEDQEVLAGKKLFTQANCSGCHIPKMTTGEHPEVSAFSNQTIRPYTDLLLHDMGEGLADHAGDFRATGREWRTPPLWGIGLFETVNGHTFYLHDGRASSLEEAILWHGGEAEAAKNSFVNMSREERGQLIKFLESL